MGLARAWRETRPPDPPTADAPTARERAWSEMVASEELILALAPRLASLDRSVRNLVLPDARARGRFAERVAVRDLAARPAAEARRPAPGLDAAWRAWPAADASRERDAAELALWAGLLGEVAYFEHARFAIERGDFPAGGRDVFDTDVKFAGLARAADGSLRWVRARPRVRWVRVDEAAAEEALRWRIDAFETRELEWVETPAPLFEEVLDVALRDDATLARARTSLHEERVRAFLADPSSLPHPRFFPAAMDRHPGLAVVDVDGDGHQDLYATARWGRNLLLRNRGDGTFEEIGAELGLDVEDHTAAAIFADFDNDGDADAYLGRTLEPSVYLENRGGRFAPPEEPLDDDALPSLVSSVNAVDFDRDGLLDLYVATYAAKLTHEEHLDRPGARKLLADFLPEADARELARRMVYADPHTILNLYGPPNRLLRNTGGGRFEPVAPELAVFANTYQAAWSDFDGDGDPDVYLANDFGPNQLFRNESGPEGARFVDVTAETGTADVGFGMGASWGDYDGDGRPDLYVSNMYSSAGERITARLGDLDPRFPKMARGNTLFRNEGGAFRAVSGRERSALPVEKAGWAWGGQFLDFDNDGRLDLVSLAGYYSAPEEFALPVDT